MKDWPADGGYVEILEGAKVGERVAVENLGKLSNGAGGHREGVVMQKLAEICIRRPVFATMLIMALVVIGGFCYTSSASIFSRRLTSPR